MAGLRHERGREDAAYVKTRDGFFEEMVAMAHYPEFEDVGLMDGAEGGVRGGGVGGRGRGRDGWARVARRRLGRMWC